MPKFTFLARAPEPKLKINIHLTKSPKQNHPSVTICINCVYTCYKNIVCLILASLYIPKLKYWPHAQNNNLCTVKNHSSVMILKRFVHRWQLNINAKF